MPLISTADVEHMPKFLKIPLSLAALFIVCFLPAAGRLYENGLTEPAGLLSDAGLAVIILFLGLFSPPWLRVVLALLWALFQAAALELYTALQRLPTWHDLQYLFDFDFVRASLTGFNLSAPFMVGPLLIAAILVAVRPAPRCGKGWCGKGLILASCLLLGQGWFSHHYDEQPVASRYNALHWLVEDALSAALRKEIGPMAEASLPEGLRRLDLDGAMLVPKGNAKNVLIIVLEGLTGLYHPEIRRAMEVNADEFSMDRLAQSTSEAMLIPDFSVHSHQTIRGLYSILCGDFSKLSADTPKALELLQDPSRSKECLPAQLADNGWSTHFLQAAGLQFMAKDKVMQAIGFHQVHGSEWFAEPNPFPFDWGATDEVFFRGARKYIKGLRGKRTPWMLTLLTVGTHQPYAVTDEVAEQYPSRKIATVAILDKEVAQFIEGLRRDGVLKDTLVLITSDESHGSELADWISSWGLGIVLAPEQRQLPRIKEGGYGLVDVSASILDYLGLKPPPSTIGRSFFRDYERPREMVSFTASKLRWLTAGNRRYECTENGSCRVGTAKSILGDAPADFRRDKKGDGAFIFSIAQTLDNKLAVGQGTRVLQFANGEERPLPEKVINEWTDSLVGAQYLDFPAESTVHVSVRVKAVKAPTRGINLNLSIKEWEVDSHDIVFDNFPVLQTGEEGRVEFSFYNPKARQCFSFFLVGEGKDALVSLEDFTVTIERNSG